MANRFLDQLETPPPAAPSREGKQNRFLSTIEGVEFAPPPEGFLKRTGRNLVQPILGAVQRFTWPADAIKLLSEGASKNVLAELGEEEPELKGEVAEAARQKGISYLPTQSSIEQFVEAKTGVPLTPKTKLQKLTRLGGTAAAFRPNAPLTAGLTAPAIAGGLQLAGVPEQVAEPAGLVASGIAPSPSISKIIKPSGLPARRFENVAKQTKVSPSRYEKIQETVEQDFRKVADQILGKNRTYSAMKEDNLFKEKIGDLLDKTEELAAQVPGEISAESLRGAFKKRYNSRETKGITPSEFEIAFRRNIRDINKKIPYDQKVSALELHDQFRKNNSELRELFEPSKTGAQNRAKKEALLEYNRAIQDVIEKKYPDTDFKDLFEFTNRRWSEIMDVEQIDQYFNDIFKGKVDFNKAKKVFQSDKSNISKSLKRTIGEEGFNDFKALVNDLMTTQKAMGYIKKAENAGFGSLAKTAGLYLIHPKLATAKLIVEHGKHAWQMLLDKPQLAVTWKHAIDDLKSGNYAAAQEGFRQLDKEFSKPIRQNQDKTNLKSRQ